MARLRGSHWQGDVTVKGKRLRQDGFATEEQAEAWEAKTKADAKLGKVAAVVTPEVLGREAGLTLSDAVKKTVSGIWRGKPGLINSERNAMDAVGFFGADRRVSTIGRPDLAQYVAHLKEKTANSDATINRKLASISRVLTYMEELGLITAAPTLKGLRKKEGEGRIRYLRDPEMRGDPSEEELVLQTFRLWSMEAAVDFCIFLIDTGARWRSEGLTLHDERINWRNGLIIFAGSLTKSKRTRAVPMTDRVRAILERRKGRGLLFGDIDKNWFPRVWDRMKVHIGLEGDNEFVPHCLRHTCASRLVQAGEDLYRVQQWLGHSTISQTMRYAHLAPKHLLSGAAALNLYNQSRRDGPELVVVK